MWFTLVVNVILSICYKTFEFYFIFFQHKVKEEEKILNFLLYFFNKRNVIYHSGRRYLL